MSQTLQQNYCMKTCFSAKFEELQCEVVGSQKQTEEAKLAKQSDEQKCRLDKRQSQHPR